MKERPILMSGPMVRATLLDLKTQTRRVIRPQPPIWVAELVFLPGGEVWRARHQSTVGVPSPAAPEWRCPFGVPGDRLWVRETWAPDPATDCLRPSEMPEDTIVRYPASGESWMCAQRWRPSIFMPRWASRLTLEVIAVRAERVQGISEEDAQAEGCHRAFATDYPEFCSPTDWTYRADFAALWDSLNAKRGYPRADNPWVWVVEFRRLAHQPQDACADVP